MLTVWQMIDSAHVNSLLMLFSWCGSVCWSVLWCFISLVVWLTMFCNDVLYKPLFYKPMFATMCDSTVQYDECLCCWWWWYQLSSVVVCSGRQELELKRGAIQLISDYIDVVVWFLSVDLLPEHPGLLSNTTVQPLHVHEFTCAVVTSAE